MHSAPKEKPGLAWRAAAQALAVRTLLLQAALRSGVDHEPIQLGEGREESAEEALIRSFLESEIDPEAITEADCRAAYEARPPQAAEMSYDELVKPLFEHLERAAWTRSAKGLVDRLVADAQITGIDMAPLKTH